MKLKILDYLTKGLNLEVRQIILEKLNNISSMSLKRVLERPYDYPTLKRIGYTKEQIDEYLDNILKHFMSLNKYIERQNRNPFFNTNDVYECAKHYFYILEMREEEELKNIMGCSYEEYKPQILYK